VSVNDEAVFGEDGGTELVAMGAQLAGDHLICGAADDGNVNVWVAVQSLEDLNGRVEDGLPGWSKGVIDVEEDEGPAASGGGGRGDT
jgi:hypothetical protein